MLNPGEKKYTFTRDHEHDSRLMPNLLPVGGRKFSLGVPAPSSRNAETFHFPLGVRKSIRSLGNDEPMTFFIAAPLKVTRSTTVPRIPFIANVLDNICISIESSKLIFHSIRSIETYSAMSATSLSAGNVMHIDD